MVAEATDDVEGAVVDDVGGAVATEVQAMCRIIIIATH